MKEQVFHKEGGLVELLIQMHLRFKIREGILEEVSPKTAADTIKRVVEECYSGRNSVSLKEFLVDLRNLATKEGYALLDAGVEGNPMVSISELQEELEDVKSKIE